jgi:hypothetical protein
LFLVLASLSLSALPALAQSNETIAATARSDSRTTATSVAYRENDRGQAVAARGRESCDSILCSKFVFVGIGY